MIVAVATLRSPQGNASEELRDAQLVDPVLEPLLRGKEAGRKPSADELGNVSQSPRHLLQIWDQLIVHGGVLGHRFETPEGSSTILQTIVPEALRKECSLTSMKVPWEGIWEPTRCSPVLRRGFTGQDTLMTSVTGVVIEAPALPARAPFPRAAHP